MDSQRDGGADDPIRSPHPDGDAVGFGPDADERTTGVDTIDIPVAQPRADVAHYRRPLLGIPWIAGLLLVPLLLAALGIATRSLGTAGAGTPGATASASNNPTAAPAGTGPVLEIITDSKSVILGVWVKDSTSQKTAAAALRSAYGQTIQVIDKLKTDAGALSIDSAGFAELANGIKGLSGVILNAQGGSVTLSGLATTDAAKNAALDGIKKAFPDAAVTSTGVVVGDPDTAPASCEATPAYVAAVTARTRIQFATGGTTLTAASTTALTKIADAVKKCPNLKVQVAGNSDNVGNAASNKTLSQQRATAVQDKLVALGVPAAGITAVGNGEEHPIASNDTVDGRTLNRRVDITVS